MCGKAFGISDIGQVAADAEGIRSLAVVAAVQMLEITGGVHIGDLVATVRRRTLETGPDGWEWWWWWWGGGGGRCE
jgi:hypothetical protein